MNSRGTLTHRTPVPIVQGTAWLLTAVALGSVAALAGLPVLYGFIAIAAIVIYATLITQYAAAMMATSIWVLALAPFSFGIETGVAPKLFVDEVMLLLYLALLLPIYWSTARVWQRGFGTYYWVLAVFVVCQCMSLLVGSDLIAFRNLLETYVLGPMLLVVFLQEGANTDHRELIANSVVWLTVVIAALSVLERAFQRNPILERMELQGRYQYLSPQIVAITEGVYRPYVTFFHPSEAATFMALGVPFAIRGWLLGRRWIAGCQLLIIVAGLGVNATRGVWVAVAVSLLLLARNPLLIVISAIPATGLGGFLAYLALRSTPFMQRLSDLNNLFGRFIYWQLALKVFADHKLLGVGHMQFQKVYLDYVRSVSQLAQINLKQIYVIDNIYLTILAEHGIIGLAALITLLIYTAVLLRTLHRKLLAAGQHSAATLLRAAQMVLVVYAVSGFFADVNQFTKATKFFFILTGFCVGAGVRSLRKTQAAESNISVTTPAALGSYL